MYGRCQATLCCVFKRNTEKPSRCFTTWTDLSETPTVSIMFLICSFYLLISHLKPLGSWQLIKFPSPGRGWGIIRPHQAWRSNHCWAFFSHGVFFLMTRPLTAYRLPVCPNMCVWGGASWRYTDRDGGWRQLRGQTHQSHPSVTATKQCTTQAPKLSACAMLRDIPEDCQTVCTTPQHQDLQMAHFADTQADLSLLCQGEIVHHNPRLDLFNHD